MAEPAARTQRASLELTLRLEGLGSVGLPLMVKVVAMSFSYDKLSLIQSHAVNN